MTQDGRDQYPQAAEYRARLERIRSERAAFHDKVRQLFSDPTFRVCSTDLMQQLDCPFWHAQSTLRKLEKDGFLTSTKETSPRTGLGRRYYRRA
jgi:hypothetical protein